MKSELDGSWAKFRHRLVFLEARASGDSDSATRATRAAGIESRLNDMAVGGRSWPSSTGTASSVEEEEIGFGLRRAPEYGSEVG